MKKYMKCTSCMPSNYVPCKDRYRTIRKINHEFAHSKNKVQCKYYTRFLYVFDNCGRLSLCLKLLFKIHTMSAKSIRSKKIIFSPSQHNFI